jgi:hypothetical protein
MQSYLHIVGLYASMIAYGHESTGVTMPLWIIHIKIF